MLGIVCVDTRTFYVATRPCPGLGAATKGPQTPGASQGLLEPTVEALAWHCGRGKTCIITEVALEARVSCTTTREAVVQRACVVFVAIVVVYSPEWYYITARLHWQHHIVYL